MPSATSSRTVDQTTWRLRGSRPVVGSSSTSSCGCLDQAGGQVDAAPLAAGELLDEPVRELGSVKALEQLIGDARGLAAAAAAQAGHQLQVLPAR